MRDDQFVVIHPRPGESWLFTDGSGRDIMYATRQPDGVWRFKRASDRRVMASVSRDGDGRVSLSLGPLDRNHLARVVACIVAGRYSTAERLCTAFVLRHRSVVFGTE